MKIIRVSEEDWDSNVDRIADLEAELKQAQSLLADLAVHMLYRTIIGTKPKIACRRCEWSWDVGDPEKHMPHCIMNKVTAFLEAHHD